MIRKLLRLLTILFAAALVLPAGTAAGSPTAKPATPAVYLSLGDSLAVGVGAIPGPGTDVAGGLAVPPTSYAGRIWHVLHGEAGRVDQLVSLGRGGETTTSFIGNGQLAAAQQEIAKASDVRMITLSLGGNDFLSLISGVCANPQTAVCLAAIQGALTTAAANYPIIVGSLVAAASQDAGGAEIVVTTVYNPFSGTDSIYEQPVDRVLLGADGVVDCAATANPLNVGLNDIITCTAQSAGVKVADVYPLFQGKGATLTHIMESDIHPTDAGYAAIATAIRRALGV